MAEQRLALSSSTHCPVSMALVSTPSTHSNLHSHTPMNVFSQCKCFLIISDFIYHHKVYPAQISHSDTTCPGLPGLRCFLQAHDSSNLPT